MELNKQIKQTLDLYKNDSYSIHIISKEEENRPDKILYKYFKNDYKKLQFIFYYMNNITYPLNELTKGRYIKIYNFNHLYDIIKLNQ